MQGDEMVGWAAEIAAAYVSHNNVPAAELPGLIGTIRAALAGLGREAVPEEPRAAKATTAQIRRSVTPETLISFEDGKPYKTLRRHLTLRGLTPEAYRAKWGLPGDYPMVSASYSEQRSALARSLGLGQKRAAAVPESATVAIGATATPKRRGRKKAVTA